MKRLSDNIPAGAAAAGLVLLALVLVAALGDHTGLALVGVAALQVLVLGVVLILVRRSSAAATAERVAAVAELTRAISNMGLRSVDETRAATRELAAQIAALADVGEPPLT